jgi:hypothetical protein
VVQALIPDLAIEALDAGILRRLTGVDEVQFPALLEGPLVCEASGCSPKGPHRES